MARVEKAGLRVDEVLARFINEQALPGSGVEPQRFWEGLSTLIHEFGPRNRALLERREELQAAIDAWHIAHRGRPVETGPIAISWPRSATWSPRARTSRSRPRTPIPNSPASPVRSWWSR